jgi:putative molybdopterin biosynthesis protein
LEERDLEKTLKLLSQLKPVISIRLVFDERVVSEEDIHLLETLADTGSLKEASKKLGVDYKTLWLRLKKIEQLLGVRLADKKRGGVRGGGFELTFAAEALMERYRVVASMLEKTLKNVQLKPDLIIYGSDCPGIELAGRLLAEKGLSAEYLRVGSQMGLELLLKGYSHLAGVHVIDPETGEYNLHLIKKNNGKDLVLIRGYWREMGFIVAPGNPKNIFSPEDLLRRDVVLANRNKGSGTHILLNYLLKKLSREYGIPLHAIHSRIKGYDSSYVSHREAALRVLNGKADVTIGPLWTAKSLGLDFIPITRERFDFITLGGHINSHPVKMFIEVIRSKDFSDAALRLGIFTDYDTGKIIK